MSLTSHKDHHFLTTDRTRRVLALLDEIDEKLGEVQDRTTLLRGKMMCNEEDEAENSEGEDSYSRPTSHR